MSPKIKWVAYFVLFLLPETIWAQPPRPGSLSLEGRPSYCLAGEIKNPDLYCYKLHLTYKNEGTEPVILINPNLGYGTGLKEAKFYFKYSEFDPEKNATVEKRSVKTVAIETDSMKNENFVSMAKFFDGDSPPENMTVIVQPGETYSFDDRFEIKAPYVTPALVFRRWTKDDGKEYTSSYQPPRVGASFITLTYEFSFLGLMSDPDFLEKLQNRWRRSGYLPVGKDGTFTISTGPMLDINGSRVGEDEQREKMERIKRDLEKERELKAESGLKK